MFWMFIEIYWSVEKAILKLLDSVTCDFEQISNRYIIIFQNVFKLNRMENGYKESSTEAYLKYSKIRCSHLYHEVSILVFFKLYIVTHPCEKQNDH